MTLYINRYDLSSEPEPTPSIAQLSTTDYQELRGIGSSLDKISRAASRRKEKLKEAIRKRREYERELNADISDEYQRLKKKDKLNTPEGQARIAEMRRIAEEKLAQEDARIAQYRENSEESAQRYSQEAKKYTEDTYRAALKAAPKNYKADGVATLKDLDKERQRQAADKELLNNISKESGIIRGDQFKSQLYQSRYGGGVYTTVEEGTFRTSRGDTVTISPRSAPYTDAKTGQTKYQLIPKQKPSEKTVYGIDLFQYGNRAAVREMIGDNQVRIVDNKYIRGGKRYKTAGELFGSTMVSTQDAPLDIKPGRFSKEDLLAARYNKGKYEFERDVAQSEADGSSLYKIVYNKEWDAGVALFALETKNNAQYAAKAFVGGLSWRAAETLFNRAAERGGTGKLNSGVRIFGKTNRLLGKVAAPVAGGYYAYDFNKNYNEVEQMPDSITKTRASASLLSKTALEGFGFYAGYSTTAKIVPLSAYKTAPPTTIEFVSVREGTQVVRGTSVTPVMLSAPRTTFYSSPVRFEGVRGIFGKPVRTVSTIGSRGGFTQKQFSKNFVSVTRQAPGSTISTTTVYRPGKATKTYRRGDVRSSFTDGAALDPYFSRFRRSEKGFADDTVLLQRGRRVTLYGNARQVSPGTYNIATARQEATIVAVSRARPTTFSRSTSQVERVTYKPKLRGKVEGLSFYSRNARVRTVGAARQSLYGLTDTQLRTAPSSVVRTQNFLVSSRSKVDTPLPSEPNAAYPVKTLLARKGDVSTRITYRIVTTGRIERVKVGSRPIITSAEVQEQRIRRQLRPNTEAPVRDLPSGNTVRTVQQTSKGVAVSRLSARNVPKTRTITLPRSALSSRTSIVAAPIIQQRPSSRTNAVVSPRVTPRITSVPRTESIVRPAVISRVNPATVSASRLSTSQISVTRLNVARVPGVGIPGYGITRIPIKREIIPKPPFYGRQGGDGFGKRGGFMSSQAKKYTPSLYAIGVGIKGKKPGKAAIKSGFTIRPITS